MELEELIRILMVKQGMTREVATEYAGAIKLKEWQSRMAAEGEAEAAKDTAGQERLRAWQNKMADEGEVYLRDKATQDKLKQMWRDAQAVGGPRAQPTIQRVNYVPPSQLRPPPASIPPPPSPVSTQPPPRPVTYPPPPREQTRAELLRLAATPEGQPGGNPAASDRAQRDAWVKAKEQRYDLAANPAGSSVSPEKRAAWRAYNEKLYDSFLKSKSKSKSK